jgi:hypothetical protein
MFIYFFIVIAMRFFFLIERTAQVIFCHRQGAECQNPIPGSPSPF